MALYIWIPVSEIREQESHHDLLVESEKKLKIVAQRCAEIVEAMERKEWETIGDPRIPKFTSYKANAIRKEFSLD